MASSVQLSVEVSHEYSSNKQNKMEQKPKPFLQTATGIAVSVGVLFVTVWVISKAWKTGQKAA